MIDLLFHMTQLKNRNITKSHHRVIRKPIVNYIRINENIMLNN